MYGDIEFVSELDTPAQANSKFKTSTVIQLLVLAGDCNDMAGVC